MIERNGRAVIGMYRGGINVTRAYHGEKLIFDAVQAGERIPAEYQEVEYITFNGNQYFYTGHYPTQETKLEIKLRPTATRGAWASNSGSGLSNNFTGYVGTSSSNCRFGNKTVAITTSLNNEHTIIQSKEGLYLDGVRKGGYDGYNDFESTLELRIGYNSNSYYQGRVYYCKLWDNWVLIREFVPCYRKDDGVAGFYDVIGKTFYGSDTNTDFVEGPDV